MKRGNASSRAVVGLLPCQCTTAYHIQSANWPEWVKLVETDWLITEETNHPLKWVFIWNWNAHAISQCREQT